MFTINVFKIKRGYVTIPCGPWKLHQERSKDQVQEAMMVYTMNSAFFIPKQHFWNITYVHPPP